MNKFTTSFIIGLFATILLTSTITASQIPIVNLQKNLESSIWMDFIPIEDFIQ